MVTCLAGYINFWRIVQYRLFMLVFITLVMSAFVDAQSYCLPTEACWPSSEDITNFKTSLVGTVILPSDSTYDDSVAMTNERVTKSPSIVALVSTTEDVQKSMKFARLYNIRVSIHSSGNDFIGRSTCDDCMQINMGSMKAVDVLLNSTRHSDGEVTVESGCPWKEIYEKVDSYKRVVLGGSSHTVSPAGYTLGGGHSAISRSFGLAVDNILDYVMVTVDGDIVKTSATGTVRIYANGTESATSDTDLFWALRGGGGGTFGVVTTFTFKLHLPPAQVVKFQCYYVLIYEGQNIGDHMIKTFTNLIRNLPTAWGGYITILGVPVEPDMFGLISFTMNHYGALSDEDKKYLDPVSSICPNHTFTTYDTFWEYEQTIVDESDTWLYTFNTFMTADDFDEDWRKFVIDHSLNPPTNSVFGCTGTLIGGKVKEVDSRATAVHPAFRSSDMSLTCYVAWSASLSALDTTLSSEAAELGKQLQRFGNGVYMNEPSAAVLDWKKNFWGKTNYDRLLEIKKAWDSDNFLQCLYSVGSSYSTVKSAAASNPMLTQLQCILFTAFSVTVAKIMLS